MSENPTNKPINLTSDEIRDRETQVHKSMADRAAPTLSKEVPQESKRTMHEIPPGTKVAPESAPPPSSPPPRAKVKPEPAHKTRR